MCHSKKKTQRRTVSVEYVLLLHFCNCLKLGFSGQRRDRFILSYVPRTHTDWETRDGQCNERMQFLTSLQVEWFEFKPPLSALGKGKLLFKSQFTFTNQETRRGETRNFLPQTHQRRPRLFFFCVSVWLWPGGGEESGFILWWTWLVRVSELCLESRLSRAFLVSVINGCALTK